ncbi:hypothetical protein SASPL_111351 [Salvia splendens]|uniref:X8 domain-containing protein n=1 Tax=Salvia splendens TaxID=180675 RepID=A0A8X8YCB4_SALSN|nr:hypothetical protein SASPL_111351 [Salvia splendens]
MGPTATVGIVVVATLFCCTKGFVGMNWGRMSARRLLPSQVVDLMLQNRIRNVPDYDINWRGLNYVQDALNEVGLGQTKANIVHNSDELIPNITKPSEASFRDNIKDRMSEFLREHDAPFSVDFRPIGDLERCCLDPSFAFPDNKSKLVINYINGAVYTNGFHWQYDCFVWALEKLNFSYIKVVATVVGWPTDGYPGASADNVERYFKYLLSMVTSNKGSPKRQGAPIDVFINSLADEPKMKIGMLLSPSDRHWGIYSGNSTDTYKVRRQVELACRKGDCTTLAPGASCSNLGLGKTASYAFNVYFQTYFQHEQACDFEGLSYITDQDPSTEDCLFPVEMVRGNQLIEFSAALALHRPLNIRGAVLVIVLYIFL